MKNTIVKIACCIGLLYTQVSVAQDLQSFIDIAISNSPTISQVERQHKIALEKVNEVKDLPNTEFAVGYFVSEPETRTGPQRFKISAKQMIPWFGTNASKEAYSNAMASTVEADMLVTRKKLIVAVTQTYYELYAIQSKQRLLEEHFELLKVLEGLTLKEVETSNASAVEILKLQMRLNDLDKNRQLLIEESRAVQTRFNKLLNRNSVSEIVLIKDLKLPETDFEPQVQALKVHPELLKFDNLTDAIIQEELVLEKQRNPMLGFGLDYVNVAARTDMDVADNGKDIVMPMVTVSIPIFTKKYDSKSKQINLKEEKNAFEKQDRLNSLEIVLQQAISKRNSARISYNTQLKNLEQSSQLKNILIKKYEVGSANLKDVLEVDELQLNIGKEQIMAVQQYYIQSSMINYLIAN